MAQKSILILNAKSAARSEVRKLIKPMQRELNLDVVIPWSGKQLRKTLRKAVHKGVTRIIAGGGDGTLNSVANAVLALGEDVEVSMGLVPLGTANDFARAYGNDGSDISDSIRVAVTGQVQRIDVGRINSEYFVNVASGGFGAMITATTPQDVKRRLGGLAYTLSGLARLAELTPTAAHISLDGNEARKTNVSALVIGNSRYAGGGFDVAPNADVSDGKLDLGIISSDGILSGPGGLAKLLDPTDPTGGLVERAQFRTALIETESPFHLNLDGEPMVESRFEIETLASRLSFVLPRPTS